MRISRESLGSRRPGSRQRRLGQQEKARFSSVLWLSARLAAILLVVLAALYLPLPLLVMEPGPTTDVSKLIHVESPTFESKGSYLLTTALITSTEGVTLPGAVSVVLDPDKELVSRESIFPSNSSRVNTDRVHAAQMTESQQVAAVAALHELGMPSAPEGVFIRQIDMDAPAAGELRPGDVIVAVEGKPIFEPEDLVKAIEGRQAGQEVKVTVRREAEEKELKVATKKVEDGTGEEETRLGVLVVPKRKLPVNISIDAGDIGGPSAGLVFGLAIYDALTPGDLTRGRNIAGTGGIANVDDRFGIVMPVGAVAEKVKAAGRKGVDVFLVPKANISEARSAAEGSLKVIPVSTLHGAIRALER